MSESGDTPRAPEPPKQSLLNTATRYFVSVSNKYPAAEIAQGAALALLCQDSWLHPVELSNALVTDPDRLEGLARAASTVHAASSNPEIKTLPQITPELVQEIILTDFTLAMTLKKIEPSKLREFLERYPDAKEGNEEAVKMINALLEEAKKP